MSRQITSASAVRRELEDLRPKLNLGESEESWDTIAGGLQRLSSIINNGGGDFPEELASGLRSLARPITNAMCSERTRLSGSALDLANTLATTLGSQYELLLPLIFPTLLLLCSRTNKIVLNRARACILTTIESTQLASILTYLHQVIKDKAASLRIVAAEATLACLNSFNPPDLERENRAVEIEDILRSAAKDANPDVRKFSKQIFEAYKLVLPHRLDSFATPLTPTTKKYLNIQVSSRPATTEPPPRSQLSKTYSVTNLRSMPPPLPPPSRSRAHSRAQPEPPIISSSGPSRPIREAPTMASSKIAIKEHARIAPSRPKIQASTSSRPTSRPQRPASATGYHEKDTPITASIVQSLPRRLPAPPPALAPATSESKTAPMTTGSRSQPSRNPAPLQSEVKAGAGSSRQVQRLPATTRLRTSQSTTALNAKPLVRLVSTVVATKSTSSTCVAPRPADLVLGEVSSSGLRTQITPFSPEAAGQSQPGKPQSKKAAATGAATGKPVWGKATSNRTMAPKHINKAVKTTRSTQKGPKVGATRNVQTLEEHEAATAIVAVAVEIPLPPSPPTTKPPELASESPLTPTGPSVIHDIHASALEDPIEPAVDDQEKELKADITTRMAEGAKFPNLRNALTITELNTPTGFSSSDLFALHSRAAKTPISALMSSIHHGFLFSPSSPLSPPAPYAPSSLNASVDSFAKLPSVEFGVPTSKDQSEVGRTILQDVDMN